VNSAANWLLVAACFRTLQSIALGIYIGEYFAIYPDNQSHFNLLSLLANLVGTFICTLGTAIICDRYDNINYMTKAYICIATTFISIPCCAFIFLTS
jgi:hypothetical protein